LKVMAVMNTNFLCLSFLASAAVDKEEPNK
jgi:hypothetical protein